MQFETPNPLMPRPSAGRKPLEAAYAWETPKPAPKPLARLNGLTPLEFMRELRALIEARWFEYREKGIYGEPGDWNAMYTAWPGGYCEFEANQTRAILFYLCEMHRNSLCEELSKQGFK